MDKQVIGDDSLKGRNNVTGSTLKIIAIVTMLIDHTAATVLSSIITTAELSNGLYNFLYYLYYAMRMIGRIAFPIFIFLLIEGAIHTRNKLKYALRLSLFAIVSEIPFDLAFNNSMFDFSYQNVFFTLAIGMFMIIGFDLVERDKIPNLLAKILFAFGLLAPAGTIVYLYKTRYSFVPTSFDVKYNLTSTQIFLILFAILLILTFVYLLIMKHRVGHKQFLISGVNLLFLSLAVFIAALLKTDYSAMGILAIAIMYRLRTRKPQNFLLGCLVLIIFSVFEIPALLGLIPINKYNGERGLKLKYIFYIFYPAHLLILYGITMLILL